MGVRTRLLDTLAWNDYEREYECLGCGARLDVVYHTCPACGSFAVDRRAGRLQANDWDSPRR